MKLFKQMFAYETTMKTNLRFLPQRLLASAWLATAGAQASEAKHLHLLREKRPRTASVTAVGGRDWMAPPTHGTCRTHPQPFGRIKGIEPSLSHIVVSRGLNGLIHWTSLSLTLMFHLRIFLYCTSASFTEAYSPWRIRPLSSSRTA